MSGNRRSALVALTKGELGVAKHLSEGRFNRARGRNAYYRKLGEKNDYHNDFIGICAELAFCKLTRAYPDQVFREEVASKRQGKDLGDTNYKGLNIDVKSTIHKNGVIWIDQINENVDYYAFVIVDEDDWNCEIVGVIHADDLHNKEPRYRKNFKFPCKWAEQEELTSWEDFNAKT